MTLARTAPTLQSEDSIADPSKEASEPAALPSPIRLDELQKELKLPKTNFAGETTLASVSEAIGVSEQSTSIEHTPNNFSSTFVSQSMSTVNEALLLLSQQERQRVVGVVLSERPPDDIQREEYRSLIKNPEVADEANGVPHGRGTLGVMASNSPACAGTTENVSVYLTHDASPSDTLALLKSLKESGRMPMVVNASHGSFNLDGANESIENLRALFQFAKENNILINIAAGNGRTVEVPEEFADILIYSTSLDASGQKSSRASEGDHVTVGVMSDRYQMSTGMYHGWTSGAAPVVSSALILLKKVHPEITAQQAKALLAASADEIASTPRPSPETGYGSLNAPKLIVMAQLLREGVIDSAITTAPDSLESAREAYRTARENGHPIFSKAFTSVQQAKTAFEQASSPEQIEALLPKLKLSYSLHTDGPEHEAYRSLVSRAYQQMGNLHQAALFSPRSESGRLLVDSRLVDELVETDLSKLSSEDYLKFCDLVKGIELNEAQIERLKTSFSANLKSYNTTPQAADILASINPPEKDGLLTLQAILGSGFDSYISKVIEENPEIAKLLDRIKSKSSKTETIDPLNGDHKPTIKTFEDSR